MNQSEAVETCFVRSPAFFAHIWYFVLVSCRARGQIEHFEGDVTEAWGVQSEATLGLQERLQNARQLVAHLEAGFGAR